MSPNPDRHDSDGRDPWIGRTLGGEFRIERELGAGGFGTVYLAEQTGVGRHVVVKLIRRALTENRVVVERFKREARIAARLNHPNVVQLFTAGQTDDGGHYLVMEYVPGPTLHELVHREAPLAEARAVRIGAQIAAGLAAAHEAGIVHRDLKPANVILTRLAGSDEHAKVLDFGIAKLLERNDEESALTASDAIVGTPAYMSPEQVSGHAIDGRSDIYTLGVMLYEMVTGKHPFDAATPVQYIIQHLQQPVTPPSIRTPGVVLSPRFEEVLRRCLAKEPDARFESARALHDELARMSLESSARGIAPEPSAALAVAAPLDPAPGRRQADPATRVIAAVVGVIAVVLILGAAALVAVIGDRDEPIESSGAVAPDPPLAPDGPSASPPPVASHATAARVRSPQASEASASADLTKPSTDAAAPAEPDVGKPPRPSRPTPTLDGPGGALLPAGAVLRMRSGSLVSYSVAIGVPELAPMFIEHYRSAPRVMLNSDGANDPDDPFFSVLFPGVESGVHMISVIHDGAGRATVNYFLH